MLRTLLMTTALVGMPAAAIAQDAIENQEQQQQQSGQHDAIVSSGDTLTIELSPDQGSIQLNFQFVDSLSLDEEQGDQQQSDQTATSTDDTESSTDQTTSGDTATGGENRVSDGALVSIETTQAGEPVEISLRFQQAQEQTVGQDDQQMQADVGQDRQFTADEITGAAVYGANDNEIGNVGDIVLTEDGEVDAIIVDVGGFLGIGTHSVAIGLDNLEVVSDGDQWAIYTPFTREELESQPAYDEQTYNDARDQQRLMAQ